MATVDDLLTALKAADAAGNTKDAQRIAEIINSGGFSAAPAAKAPEDKSGFIPSLASSFRSSAGEAAEAVGEYTGLDALAKFGKEQREKAQGMYTPTTEADVEAAKQRGNLPAAGAYFSKNISEPVGEAIGSIAGRYGAPTAIAGAGMLFPEVSLPLAAASFGTNALIHSGENILRQKEQGQQPDYLSATTAGIGQAGVDQFLGGKMLTGPLRSIIGKTAMEEAALLAPRVLKGELTADAASKLVSGKLRNVAQATAQNAVVGAGMMTADEALRRASAGQELTSPEALETYKQQAITAAELSPLFGLAHGFGQPGKARTALGEVEKMRPPAEVAPPAEPLLLGYDKPVEISTSGALPPPEPPALSFNPLPGTPTVFPDGTVALTPEDAMARRYAAQAGTPAEPIAGFTTSKGSTYQLTPDGKTIRTKLSEGKGQGETYDPHSALYVSPDSQQRILDDKNAGGKDHSVRLGYILNKEGEAPTIKTVADHADIPEGAKPVVTVINTAKNTVVGVYPASKIPAVGLHPVEKLYNKDGTSNTHLGNEIVDIQRNLAMPEPLRPEAAAEAAPQTTKVIKQPEAQLSELEQLQAQHADLTQKMEALRIARTGKPPTPLSKSGKEYAALAAQRDEIASQMAEMSVREEPAYQEATPIKGEPAPASQEPEDIAYRAEYAAKAKELKQALKETKSDLSKTKREGYSLFQHLRGMLNANEISKRDDPQYKQLIAKNGKQGVALSTLISDGHLDDFLPMDNRHDSPGFDWQTAEEHIREKLYSKNYVTTETENAVKKLNEDIENIENQIDKHLTLKDINGLLEEAANEQRAIDQAAETIAPESKNRAVAPSEAAPAEEFNLKAETPEEIRAKQTEAEARAAEEARATKEAEDKAKADAEAGEFTLTGSDREADLAAGRGQRDIFAEEKRAQANDTREVVPDVKPEAPSFMKDQVKATEKINTPAFKRWFKKSKVVDKNGKPLVVYHGTDQSFEKFRGNAYFTPNPEDASKYSFVNTPGKEHLPNVVPAYLSLQKPKIVDFYATRNDIDNAKAAGFDGVIVRNVAGSKLDHYIVFDPTNIKSAIGNIGSYDVNNPDYARMKDKVNRKGTPEQIADRDERVSHYGGDVIYQNGDTGVYRTFNLTGDPLYRVFKGDNGFRVNLENYTGNLFTAREKIVLGKFIEDWKKADTERFKKDPFVKFDKDGVAMSQSIPEDLAGVFKEWKKMLKIDKNIYLTTLEDTRTNRLLFTGEHASIGSAGLHDSLGMMQRMRNGDYFIAFKPNTSKAKMLETLGHEMGHIHELEVFSQQNDATKKAIKDEYQKWLREQKGKSAQELIESLRARKTGKTTEVEPGLKAEMLTAYWKSFGEWYADQTAKWATTQEKPLTVVEKFFSKLGAAMKAFYARLRNGKYLPNETFRNYMDRVTDSMFDAADRPENMRPMVSDQMEMNFMLDNAKARAQQMLQKRAPMNKDAFSHIDPDTLDEVNRHFYAQSKTVIDRLDSLKGRMWQYVAQKVADEFRTIKEYTKVGHMMATQSKDTNGALEGALFHGHVTLTDGALDILTGPGKKGLIESLKPLGKELDSYHVWKVLNRESRLPESQRSHDLDALVAKKDDFIKGEINGVPRKQLYENVLKDEIALNRSVLGVALRTGLIDRFAYNRFSKDEFYIPFYRMLEDGSIQSLNQAARLTSKEFSKMLKGNNSKPFGDLMENTLRNWSHILSASMKNQAANVTIEAAREQGGATPSLKAGLAWETDPDGKNGRVVSAATGKIVGNGELVQERKNAAGETELVSLTERPEHGANDVVKTQVDGVTTYHKILDPLLYESIGAVSAGGPKGIAIDVMRPFKELLRFGVTVSPTFKVANFIKDSIQSPAVSELSPNIIKNMYNGLYNSRKDSPIYQSALAGGAIFNYGSTLEGDRSAAVRKLIAKGINEASILDTPDKIKNFFSAAWHKYEDLGNKSEAANRIALYEQLRNKGYSHLEASFHARDLMNFSATGSSNAIRFISATVPFFNARVQGLYKLGRDGILPTGRVAYNTLTGKEMWNDPNAKLSDIQKAKSFATISSAVCLGSIALYMANKDDKDFQKREQWDRDFFWWGKVPGTDYAFRIPKPFEIGALATLAERSVEQMVDAGVEGKRFGESLSRMAWQTFSFDPVPQAFKPLVDIYANKNFFTNAPIETAGMEKLSKQERITDNTSPLAKALGGVSHAMSPLTGNLGEFSPVQIDYMIRAYMGWLGGTIAATSQQAVKPFNNGVYPNTDWTKAVSLGFLEKEPSPQSAYLTDFYHNNQAIQQAYADMRHYAQLGQSEKVMEILADKKDEIGLAKFYDAQSKQLANIRHQLLIISNPKYTGLTSDQKEEEILRLKQLMSQVAEQAETARKSIKVNP